MSTAPISLPSDGLALTLSALNFISALAAGSLLLLACCSSNRDRLKFPSYTLPVNHGTVLAWHLTLMMPVLSGDAEAYFKKGSWACSVQGFLFLYVGAGLLLGWLLISMLLQVRALLVMSQLHDRPSGTTPTEPTRAAPQLRLCLALC